ncbi:helix-turn-helix domain-containing protein [Luteipulveratus mongoliensis]|uniref:helix-turn-helix domain-containing protein n=1 Tax=Luteipulveratus mongoliensis TaxID=571913 RepID=UPI00069792D2|nr:helix-turn-helix transcriptional regulator [Luteipulveratus mongoliensis]
MSRPGYPYFKAVVRSRTSPTLALQVVQARAGLSALTEVGLALRELRRAEGLSQRALATRLGVSKSMIGRLEKDPSQVPLGKVLAALEPTGYTLRLASAQGSTVSSAHWTGADLIAKDLG